METAATPPSRISRLDRRYRSRPRHVRPDEGQKIEAREKIPKDTVAIKPEPQGERQSVAMRQRHHSHHRRMAQADTNSDPVTKVVTIDVEVIATVDSSGNVVGHETRTRDPSVPTPAGSAVPAVPVVPAAVPVPEALVGVISSVRDAAASIASPVAALPVAILSSLIPGVAAAPTPVPAAVSLPQVPAVPPFPTAALPVVPSVPAVPSFPSDLRVPSYPWPSGVSAVALAASTASPVLSSRSASATPALSSATPTPTPSSSFSSLASSLSRSQIMSNSVSASLSSLDSISATLSSDSTASSLIATMTGSPTAGGTVIPGVGGGGGRPNTAPAPQGTAAGAAASGNNSPLPTPKVVGSVVGTLAGAALILAILLMLIRRHKRKRQGTLQLTGDENDRAPAMSQPSPNNNRIPSGFLNRFSGMSRSTAETSTSGGERSFQRVSGRKLPSAFSEGMTSDQFSRGGTMSGSSFYQDDQGTYGGPGSGLSKEFGKEIGGNPGAAGVGAMSFRPGPARTPIIRHPDEDVNPFDDPAPFPRAKSHLSPPQSPDPDIRKGTLGRSLHSYDGSRSSKFTENV